MPIKIKKDLNQLIDNESIRTMKKDIARLQKEAIRKGVSFENAYELRIKKERKEKEESEKRLIAEKMALEREKEKIREAEREEIDRKEAEKLRIEEDKKRIEEDKKRIEEDKKRKVAAIKAVAAKEEEEKENKREIIKREKLEKPVIAAAPDDGREDVMIKEKPKTRKKTLLEEKDKLEEIKNRLEGNFRELTDEKGPLESQKAVIFEKLKEAERSFRIIAVRERKIEEKQRLIEEKEEAAKTPEEKKKIEKERWKIEERRRELEEKRWPWDEKIRQIEKQLNEIDLKSQEVEDRVEKLIRRQKEIFEREEKIKLELEGIELEGELQRLDELKESFEEKKANLPTELNKIEQSLKTVLIKEKEIEENKKIVEAKERSVKELEKRRVLEKERWEIEEKRRKIETRRWGLEEEKHKIESQLKRIERGFQILSEKRENVTGKIKEIDQRLMGVEPEVKEEPEVKVEPSLAKPMAVKEEKRSEEAVREKIEEKKKEPPAALPVAQVVPGEEEKRRMEEARKRIEILKKGAEKRKDKEEEQRGEEEEQRRKEKAEEIIVQEQKRREILRREEEKRRKLLERFQGKKKEVKKLPPPLKPSRVIRVLPKKPTFKEKLWVRLLIVSIIILLLIGISTFWYWFFIVKKQSLPVTGCSADVDCSEGQICNPEGNCTDVPLITKCFSDTDCLEGQFCNLKEVCEQKEPGPVIPAALFGADNERHLIISNSEDLRSGISLVLQEWQEEGQFTRLIIKDTRNNKILGFKEFFEGLLIRVPEGFYQKVENDFTLFVYSQSEGNRLGFVTKIKNYEGLANLLRDQETTMENDFQAFYALMGKEKPAIIPYFKNAENISGYTGPNFRYQSLTSQDLSICYLTSGDYFVFTSSWKSMEKTVERLEIIGIRLEITTELKKGDKGYEVKLLQTWLTEEGIYKGAIGGNFGPVTETAVIRFQEKYASEILAPRGLPNGTGIVDSETRIKLNELYGESGLKPRVDELTTIGLRFGDNGEEVKLLQIWLTDEGIYKGAIGGHFRYLTKAAVVSFQEKYASEILIPQTLTRGTGIVDELTLKKLNELYGG